MKRIVVVAALAALAFLPAGAVSADTSLGGQCDGTVDVLCRTRPCQPDELDCGMIPPCLLWVRGTCLL